MRMVVRVMTLRRFLAFLGVSRNDDEFAIAHAAFGEAPVGMAAFAGVPLFQIWTALHLPAVSLPVFKGPNGLPIGAQFLAKRHDDRKLFSHARWAWRPCPTSSSQ